MENRKNDQDLHGSAQHPTKRSRGFNRLAKKLQVQNLSDCIVARDIAIDAGGLWFDYQASQTGHSIVNG